MNSLDVARQRMLEAVRAYRDEANAHADRCRNFRDKLEHYQATEAAMYEAEGVLNDITTHGEEVELCNTDCPRFRHGDCPYKGSRKHEDCPRYVERLSDYKETWI